MWRHFGVIMTFLLRHMSVGARNYCLMSLRKSQDPYVCRTSHPMQTHICISGSVTNTLRPRQNGRHFQNDIFKCILLNEDIWILLKISLKFVPKVRINNIPALVQIMAWRRPGDEPLSEPMMVSLLTHICVTRPQLMDCHQLKSSY